MVDTQTSLPVSLIILKKAFKIHLATIIVFPCVYGKRITVDSVYFLAYLAESNFR